MDPVSAPGGISSVLARIEAIRARVESMGAPMSGGVGSVAASGARSAGGVVRAQSVGTFGEVLGTYGTGAVEQGFEWGRTQLGLPYTGSLKYRMGEPWGVEPAPLPSTAPGSEKTYWFPPGTVSYDCSGFATRFYQHVGIDLVKYDATSSRSMAQNIPSVPVSEIQRGDLMIIDSDHDGTPDHVQIYEGNGRVIESSVRGVAEGPANFKDLYRVVRPSLLESSLNGGANQSALYLQQAQQNQLAVLGLLGGASNVTS